MSAWLESFFEATVIPHFHSMLHTSFDISGGIMIVKGYNVCYVEGQEIEEIRQA